MIKRKQSNSPRNEQGLLKYAWLFFRRITHKTIGLDWITTIFLERSLVEPVQEIEPKIKVQIVQANEDDLGKFKGLIDEDKYNRFQIRFRKGRICFIVLNGKKVAAFAWISLVDEFEPVSHLEVKVNDKESYLFDDYVILRYRYKGLQSALISARLRYLRNQACDKAIVAIEKNNIYPLKAYMFAGFIPKRAVTLFTILGLKIHYGQKYRVLHEP